MLILVLVASAGPAGAFAVPEEAEPAQTARSIAVSETVPLELSGEDALFAFRPGANSMYGIYLFAPEDSAVWLSARLYRANGRLVAMGEAAEGAPCAIAARLSAGEEYRLAVSGEGEATLEIARKTLGRCFDDPIRLDASGSYAKLIARAGDSHWYAFQAEDSVPATIAIAPEETGGLHLTASLLNAFGKVLGEALELEDGGCAVYGRLFEGETYYLRVEAGAEETGPYRLQVQFDARGAVLPRRIRLDAAELTLRGGGRRTLQAETDPTGAASTVLWRSSDPGCVVVTGAGEVIAVAPGEAVVTAYGFGGVSASCAVTVQGVPLAGVRFNARELSLRAGESARLDYSFEPAGAYARTVEFQSDDESVVSVDAAGQVTAVGEGAATVRLSAENGAFQDAVRVYVDPAAPRYRALLVAEQLYRKDVNKVRIGAINTAENLNAMLETFSLDGQGYESRMLLDAGRGEFVAALRSAFAEAARQDVSLLYITCHGYYQGGMSYLQFCDGSLMSAADLERELRRIPGTVAVLIDCCGSGGFLGRTATAADFNRGVIAAFSRRNGGTALNTGKYKVLTSALLEEDSYRISFDEDMTESAMATVFARALADGAGWNITRSRRAAMRADLDMDRTLTLQELYQYAARRVTWYLNMVGGSYHQNVQVWPAGDPTALFGRSAN